MIEKVKMLKPRIFMRIFWTAGIAQPTTMIDSLCLDSKKKLLGSKPHPLLNHTRAQKKQPDLRAQMKKKPPATAPEKQKILNSFNKVSFKS